MRGMIFTELLDMIEERMGLAVKDRVLDVAGMSETAHFTAVGNYPAAQLMALVTALESVSGLPRSALLEAFGGHLFRHFTREYGQFFAGAGSCLDFLGRIENYIHLEVRKLYPQAELPTFTYPERSAGRLVMEYHSPRALADLALGLIRAALEHFGEPLTLQVERLPPGDGSHARFILQRQA